MGNDTAGGVFVAGTFVATVTLTEEGGQMHEISGLIRAQAIERLRLSIVTNRENVRAKGDLRMNRLPIHQVSRAFQSHCFPNRGRKSHQNLCVRKNLHRNERKR